MKVPKLIHLLATLRPGEIKEIRKALKKEKERDLLHAFNVLLNQIRKGKINDSDTFVIKNSLPNTQFPYSLTHKLQNFILNRLAWVLLTRHKTYKLLLEAIHSTILYNRGLIKDAMELNEYIRNQALLIGHPMLLTFLAYNKSIKGDINEHLYEIKTLWNTATKIQALIVKSAVSYSKALSLASGIFIKRDLSNLTSEAKKAIKEVLNLPKLKGFLPSYIINIRKHDILFYVLSRFDLSRRFLIQLNKQSKILTSVYQPEIRAAVLARLIRQAVIELNSEQFVELLEETKTIINDPYLTPEWKANLITKFPYEHQIKGDIEHANKTIQQTLKKYSLHSHFSLTQDLISINDLFELIFLRINNNIILGKHKSVISKDLNLIKSVMSKLQSDKYDAFFNLLYHICRSVHHKNKYWQYKLKEILTNNPELTEFINFIIEWSNDTSNLKDQERYLRRLKDIVWHIPGIGHILSILNIPGWILKETLAPNNAERVGRMLTKKFLNL